MKTPKANPIAIPTHRKPLRRDLYLFGAVFTSGGGIIPCFANYIRTFLSDDKSFKRTIPPKTTGNPTAHKIAIIGTNSPMIFLFFVVNNLFSNI